MTNASIIRQFSTYLTTIVLLLFAMSNVAFAQVAPPAFDKEFIPDTIGPGSVSTLTFTIDNTNGVEPVDEMAFTDVLPTELDLAAPAFVSSTCFGTVTALDGGSTISLVDGQLGAGQGCEIIVNVTSASPEEGTYTNTTGDLTSDAGNRGTASDDLTIDEGLPGFSKSFAPSTVEFGGRSTLTFTIDNSTECGECTSDLTFLSFVDNLPPGMVVAAPANASTSCGHPLLPPTLTATPGTSVISLFALGAGLAPALEADSDCTVTVDVIGGAIGSLGNVSDNLDISTDSDGLIGKAAAVLKVTGFEDLLELSKEFINDPVAPGGTVTLEFTVTNKSRNDPATAITFSDDLETTLADLTPTLPPIPDPPCGASSSLSFSLGGVLTLSGGTLPPEGSCTFSVDLSVDGDSAPGTYPNTAGPVSGDVGGSPETGNVAGDLLFVVSYPVLTKEFTDDPVASGDTVTLEFSITNTNPGSTLSDIEFIDELTDGSGGLPPDITSGFLPFPVSVTLPPTPDPPCGAGSSLALASVGSDRQGLELTGGSLAEAGMSGDSCTFSVTVDIPTGLAGGTYTNTTEEITAVLDDVAGTPTVTGPPASDDIVVIAAPRLTKEFTDDPAVPGGSTTLVITLENADPDNDASDIAFTDDLGAALTGLTIASVDGDTCGGTPSGVSTDMFGYTGGFLATETSCTITLTLTVPAGVGGTFLNETSEVTATVATLTATSPEASDNLVVAGLLLSKAFAGPVIAGGTTTLSFTLDNLSVADATGITFTDSLAAMLPGTPDVTVVSFPATPCGGTLTSVINTLLSFSGGSVLSGNPPCSFDVTVEVPAGTTDDTYANISSGAISSLGSSPPAVAGLTVNSTLLELTKEFTDDPVEPGETVTLMFTLENLSATETVTDIAFDDDLDATLSGLEATGVSFNDCGGMAAGFPTGLFEYSGGTLLPGATCMILLDVDVTAGPLPGSVFPNTTTGVTGKVGALDVFGEPASDDLEVQLMKLSKSFDGPTTATGTAILSFTIVNLDGANSVADLYFSDDLNAALSGLVATVLPALPCGPGSAINGTAFLTLTGGSLPAGGMCTFDVTVAVPATTSSGTFVNTTSALFQYGLTLADPATANLTIEPPPTFAKVFAPDSILFSDVSTLTFTVDNSASAVAASDLSFTDVLPAGIVIATPHGASSTCGGMGNAVAGAGSFTFSGGSVGANASCTVQFDVTGAAEGAHVNTTGDLTSSSGNSGTATDTITILPEVDVSVTKGDGVTSAVPGGSLTYTIVTSNAGPSADPSVSLTDTFPAVLTCTYTSVAAGGATGNTAAGAGDLAETLSMPAGSSVTYTVSCTIDSDATGTLSNTATVVASITDNNSGNDSATDADTVLSPEADLSVTKDDGVTSAVPGGSLTYTIVASNVGLSDDPSGSLTDTFPAVLTCTYTSIAAGGATGNTAAGGGDLTETLAMPTGSSVTYTVNCDISPSATGTLSNTATVSGSVTDSNTGNNSATDADTVLSSEADLSVTKTDGLTEAVPGQTILTYTIVASNIGPSADPLVSLTDTFPADLSCTWTSIAAGVSGNTAAGSGDLTEALSMPAGSSVTYTVDCDIDPSATGTLSNSATVSGSVTDNNSGNDSATDADTVLTPEAGLSITKSSGVDSVLFGESLTYTLTVTNLGPSDSTGGTITDVLPVGLEFVSSVSGCTELAGLVTCTFGPLSNGSSVELTFVALVVLNEAGTIQNTATVEGNETNPNAANNTGVDSTVIFPVSAPIPTLSGWMLLLMTLLFAGLGIRYIRREV